MRSGHAFQQGFESHTYTLSAAECLELAFGFKGVEGKESDNWVEFKRKLKCAGNHRNVKSEVKNHLIWSVAKWNKVKWKKQSEVEWGEVKCSIGNVWGKRIFMEKVYRSSKWWEVKDWGESVSELLIKNNSYKKLYTVLSYWGVFTFCTCCILICLLVIVATFKLRCCWLAVCIVVVVLCVLL